MSQSRKGSLVEALINVLIGFGINFAANLIFLPMFGMTTLTLATNFCLGLVYTVISIARSYAIRRWFNGYIVKAAQHISG
jgi:O-antigen/teichoic acid export membrane protein